MAIIMDAQAALFYCSAFSAIDSVLFNVFDEQILDDYFHLFLFTVKQ